MVAREEGSGRLELRDVDCQPVTLAGELVYAPGYLVEVAGLRRQLHQPPLLAPRLVHALPGGLYRLGRVGRRPFLVLENEVCHDVGDVVGCQEVAHDARHGVLERLLGHGVACSCALVVRVLDPVVVLAAMAAVSVPRGVEQPSGEHVVHLVPPSPRARREERLDVVELALGDYRRHAALDPHSSEAVDAGVLLVPEHPRDVRHAELSSAVSSVRLEHLHDLRHPGALQVHPVRFPHRAPLLLVHAVVPVVPEVVPEQAHAVVLALEGVALHAPLGVLREVRAVVLGHALEERLE